ncbi:Methyl-accepting chemotaxis protein McpA [Sporomusa rhizae]|uniref:methyl-accepting chemotaxis protein n=1 Tax=Sporomusa rhizae TaxID=357999 RepID=UPI00352A7AF8
MIRMSNWLTDMSIKAKLVWMLILMSTVPLAIFIAINFYSTFSTAIKTAEADCQKRSQLVDENINALAKENFTGLRALAVNPLTGLFLADPVTYLPSMREAVINTNSIYKDANPTHITSAKGMQMIRSDNLPVVETGTRPYFKNAMQGKEVVSEVVVSRATGRFVTVFGVPVVNKSGLVTGLLQRDYDLSVLQEFVKSQSDGKIRVFIVDREGKLLADSAKKVETEADRVDITSYDFIKRALSGESGITEVDIEKEKSLISFRQNPQTGWVVVATIPYDLVRQESVHYALVYGGIGIVLILLFAGLAFAIAGHFTRPLLRLVNATSHISKGNLVVEKLDSTSRDELGLMAEAFNNMVEKLSQVLRNTQNNAQAVTAASNQLYESSEQSAQAANQVAISITEVAGGAAKQKEDVEKANHFVKDMSEHLGIITQNSHGVGLAASQTAQTAKEGGTAIENAIKNMSDLKIAVKDSNNVISELGERSREIGQIVDTMSGIAGQTNLLALNAAVEAARAGEQGYGFAVVAEEVRKLAEQSQIAAKKIEVLITDVQYKIDQAVKVMDEGSTKTDISVNAVNEAGNAFENIIEKINLLAQKIDNTVEAISQVSVHSKEIAEAVQHIDAVTSVLNSEAQTVSAATEEQSAAMQEIASLSRQLASMAAELQKVVNTFRLEK